MEIIDEHLEVATAKLCKMSERTEIKQSASDVLIADVGSLDPDVRQSAALALGKRARATDADALLAQLWVEPDFFVRDTLTWAVLRLSDASLPGVLSALDGNDDPAVRTQALHVLSKIADPTTTDRILPYLDDENDSVAAKARWALGRIGDHRVVPKLTERLGAEQIEVRNALTEVLTSFGSGAVSSLIEKLRDRNPNVRQHASEVLCFIGDPDSAPALDALVAATNDPETAVAVSALMALGELRGDRAEQALEDATSSSNPRIRAVATRLASQPKNESKLQRKLREMRNRP